MPTPIPRSIGRYDIIGRLGRGGMGDVYRARDPRIGRQVAIKVLHVDDEGLRERFLHEAQSAGNLKHRNIVTIYDFGEHDEQPYIVMEFVEGITLADDIARNPDRPLPAKLALVEELTSGLDYAHNRGIVHRDVKPANLMLDREGVLKILDFGIARVSQSGPTRIGLTQIGMLLGTPNYMSPEQVEGRPVDRRSDIFAVGLVLYELVASKKAFEGDSAHVVMNRIVREAPPALEDLCPGLDHGVIAIVSRAIQKDPQTRYQNLALMAADLASVRGRLEGQQPASGEGAPRLATPSPVTPARRPISRPGLDRDALSKLRSERLDAQLRAAEAAFEAGDYAEATAACEQAALMDPDDPRVLELLERARETLAMREWLDEARRCVDRGDLPQASELVRRAQQVHPGSAVAREIAAKIDAAEQQQQEARRRQGIADGLVRARASFAEGRFESAIRTASEILIDDPANADARAMTDKALAALEERRLREQRLQAAQAAVAQQKRVFASGRHREAIDALEQLTPAHELIAAAIADLRAELETIERRAREEQERLRRERAEVEARRQRQIADLLSRAAGDIAAGRFGDAGTALEALFKLEPNHAAGLAHRREVEEGLEQERLRAADARRRAEEARARLAEARRALSRGDFDAAMKSIDEAARCDASDADVAALRASAVAGIEAIRRAAELDQRALEAVADAQRRFDAGERTVALEALARFTPAHPAVQTALRDLRVRVAEIDRLEQDAQAEQQRRQRDAHLKDVIARGDAALAAGDLTGAGRLAEDALSLDSTHPDARALKDRVIGAIEQSRRRDEEARRARAEADRASRERRIEEQFARAREEIASGQSSEALVRLRRLRQAEGQIDGLPALLEQARAARATADRESAEAAAKREEALAVQAAADREFEQAAAQREQARALADRQERARAETEARAAAEAQAAAGAAASRAFQDTSENVPPSTSVQTSLDQTLETREPTAATASTRRLISIGALAALVIAAVAGGVVFRNRQVESGGQTTVTTTVAPTSVLAVPVLTIPAPATMTVPSLRPLGVERAISNARRFLTAGNLEQAAGEVANGQLLAPDDPELAKLGTQILTAAGERADDAKTSADNAGASGRSEYQQAIKFLRSAERFSKTGQVGRGVSDYLRAAGLFIDSLEQSKLVKVTTTTVPIIGPPPPPPPTSSTSVPPTVRSTTPTTSVTTTSIVPGLNQSGAEGILRAYSEAYAAFSFERLRTLFREPPIDEQKRIESERGDFRSCVYTFANIVISGTNDRPRIDADASKTCQPKTRAPVVNSREHHIFDVVRTQSGSWIIVGHSWSRLR